MSKYKIKRKNYFIKKGFQLSFSFYFIVLMIWEAFLIGGLLYYVSRGTMTTAYMEGGIRMENTISFFLVNFILISLIVIVTIGLSALAVFIYLSHRMAGPLYRFEKSLDDVGSSGDFRYRVRLRKKDEFGRLQEALNNFFARTEERISGLKKEVDILNDVLSAEFPDNHRLKESTDKLKEELGFFKTSN